MLECIKDVKGRPVYYIDGKRVTKLVALAYAKSNNKKLPTVMRKGLRIFEKTDNSTLEEIEQLKHSLEEKNTEISKLNEEIVSLRGEISKLNEMVSAYEKSKIFKKEKELNSYKEDLIDMEKIITEKVEDLKQLKEDLISSIGPTIEEDIIKAEKMKIKGEYYLEKIREYINNIDNYSEKKIKDLIEKLILFIEKLN
jgi:chromosome segregation ATPase